MRTLPDSLSLRRPRLPSAALAASLLSLVLGCDTVKLFSFDGGDHKPSSATVKLTPPGKNSVRLAPYVFLYDFNLKRDHPLFKELEGLREQLARELCLPPANATVSIFLFEDRPKYEAFMKARYPALPQRRAFFIAQPRFIGGPEDLFIFTFFGEATIAQDLRHEATHALLHAGIKNVPIWLDEGLAEYFELPANSKGVNPSHLEHFRNALRDGRFQVDLARLEGLTEVEEMTPAEYREAWAWMHLLLRSTPEAKKVLGEYLADLKTKPNAPPLAPRLAALSPSPEEALRKHLARLESAEPTPAAAAKR